jgi:hypothetical protein
MSIWLQFDKKWEYGLPVIYLEVNLSFSEPILISFLYIFIIAICGDKKIL